MQGTKRWIMLLATVLVLVPACAPGDIDDGDAADVVLEVVAMDNPAVTGELGTSGCAFKVEQWTATLANQPKNRLAGEESVPFNDIVMESVLISYAWVNCASCLTTDRLVGLGNITIPAAGINAVPFEPIALDDVLAGLPDIEGSSANLTLLFTARTVEGTTITQTALRQLSVESCI